jgi:arylsulfatase A-like enzyme
MSAAIFIGLLWAGSAEVQASERRPNVIVVYTDDQGSVDMGAYGAADLTTPNMDALAAKGIRFTQFYAPSPVCSPSRAGLMTGLYPVRAGVPGNVGSIKDHAGMPTEQVTMAETFKAAGYATAHIGKWHLGHSPETMPNAQGFDHSFGHMGGCIDNYSHFFYWAGPNAHDLYRNGKEVFYNGRYFPDLMVDEAVGFMEKNRKKPFFIYFAFNVPHYPYQGDVKWLNRYREQGMAYPRNLYAAFLSSMDTRLGRLMDALNRFGLSEDTIVVFQSDHGHSTEQRAHYGGGSSGPYRGAKFSLFEGGIRVPAIIRWSGHLAEGEVRNQIGHGSDWLPTLADLCGIRLVNTDIDGKSLVPVLRSAKTESPHSVLHWHNRNSNKNRWAIRKGPWKLLANALDTSAREFVEFDRFLVNVDEDPGEQTNLFEQMPERAAELEKLHREWEERCNPQ